MIQFFRHIRQKIITESQLTYLLIFTLREALLEIVGVYDALKGPKQQHRASLYEIKYNY